MTTRILFISPHSAELLLAGDDVPTLDIEGYDLAYMLESYGASVGSDVRDAEGLGVHIVFVDEHTTDRVREAVRPYMKSGRGRTLRWRHISDTESMSDLVQDLLDGVQVGRENPPKITSREEALRILNISSEDANDKRKLKAARAAAAFTAHPDRAGGSDEKMKLVNEAFNYLNNAGEQDAEVKAAEDRQSRWQSWWESMRGRGGDTNAPPKPVDITASQIRLEQLRKASEDLRRAHGGSPMSDWQIRQIQEAVAAEDAVSKPLRSAIFGGERLNVAVYACSSDLSYFEQKIAPRGLTATAQDLTNREWLYNNPIRIANQPIGGRRVAIPYADLQEFEWNLDRSGDWVFTLQDGSVVRLDPNVNAAVFVSEDDDGYTCTAYVRTVGSLVRGGVYVYKQ